MRSVFFLMPNPFIYLAKISYDDIRSFQVGVEKIDNPSIELSPGIACAQGVVHAREDHHVEEMTLVAQLGCIFESVVEMHVVIARSAHDEQSPLQSVTPSDSG